jgi:hypothetical protein
MNMATSYLWMTTLIIAVTYKDLPREFTLTKKRHALNSPGAPSSIRSGGNVPLCQRRVWRVTADPTDNLTEIQIRCLYRCA